MSDFQPQTTFYLLRNVKLDHSYTNTIDFNTKEEQYNYFFNKKAFEVLEGTYQRKTIGVVRVPFLYDDIATCNYIMWQNANYSDKWYYAFILEIKYINPNLSEIIYDLDVIQTYMFDVEWKPSQIDRDMGAQFSDTGIPFVNREVEDLNYGSDYDTVYEQNITQIPNVSFMVLGFNLWVGDSSTNVNNVPLNITYAIVPVYVSHENNIPSNIQFKINNSDLTNIGKVLKFFATDKHFVNRLVSLKLYPFIPSDITYTRIDNTIFINSEHYEATILSASSNIFVMTNKKDLNLGAYTKTIQNNKYSNIPSYTENKMYMFPYTFGVLTNKRGQDFVVKLEDVNTINLELIVQGSISNEPKIGYVIPNYNINGNSLTNVNGLKYEQTQGIIESVQNDGAIVDDYTASYLQSNSNSIRVANANAKLIMQSALDRANNTFNTNSTILDNKTKQANTNFVTDIVRVGINSAIKGAETSANFGASSKLMGVAVGMGTLVDGLVSSGQNLYNTQESIRNSALLEANTLKNANISANTDYQVAVATTNAKVQDASCVPPTSKQLGGDYIFDIIHGCDGIYFQLKTVKPYYAEKLQAYWKRYGYKENAFRLPNLKTRRYWNYIKCVQANIFGNIPQDDLLSIRDIYMEGITIWHDDDIGNYSRDNEYIGE